MFTPSPHDGLNEWPMKHVMADGSPLVEPKVAEKILLPVYRMYGAVYSVPPPTTWKFGISGFACREGGGGGTGRGSGLFHSDLFVSRAAEHVTSCE
jgi:hypothetical protein